MSLKLMSAVWDLQTESHTRKLVLLALADNANDEGICWPSVATIARKCDLSEQGVRNQLTELEAEKLLTIKHRRDSNGDFTSNIYQLKLGGGQRRGVPLLNGVEGGGQPGGGGVVNGVGGNHHSEPSLNRKREPEAFSLSLEAIKERYEHLTLNTLNISLYDVQSTIVEWLKHYTVEDLVLTLGYLKREIKAGTRQRGALNFRNIFDPTKFMDDLSMAKGVARVKKVDPARESVLKAAGFPVEAPSNPVKTPKDSLEKIQAGWKTVQEAAQ